MNRTSQAEIVQYEVAGLEVDRDMIRSLANRLATEGPHADPIRAKIKQLLAGQGSIAGALRRSPLVGANLDLTRDRISPREIGL